MGANLQILGFDDKIKTVEQAKADFDKRAEQDRYENGHSYSGSFGMLGSLHYTAQIFDTVGDFETFLENKEKNDGYLARVRVIRETKPLIAARKLYHTLKWKAAKARDFGLVEDLASDRPFATKKGTPAQIKRTLNRFETAQTRYKTMLAAQVAKSTKTRFVAGGWVSE